MMQSSSDAATTPPRVVLRNVSKNFGKTAALRGVSLSARAGSIHAVTGENGAGKSTLMKLLAGVHEPDAGEIWLGGRAVRLSSPALARRAGVSTVFQELTVLPNLSVAENLCLGREPVRGGALDRAAMVGAASAVLRRTGIALEPGRPCASLSIGEQQLLEIAKGVAAEADVFIFDEPTAPLNRAEVDQLEQLLRQLRAGGKLVFYISHRLEEIFRFCDTVTVLKDGQHVDTQPITELTPQRLVTLMVGRELQDLFPQRVEPARGEPLLRVQALKVAPYPAPVSLTLHRGEIVGMAGLEGQGQREILRTLAGAVPSSGGDVRVGPGAGEPLDTRGGTAVAIRLGVALVPEDRKAEGLYLDLAVRENIWLGLMRGLPLWRKARRPLDVIRALAGQLNLRGSPLAPVVSLSGGNQQKVMLGRWLAAGMRVLLVEQPTRGVDVGAKAEIYRLLRQFVEDGGTVLAVSGDLPELMGLCDRILVVRQGAVVADVPAAGATEEALLGLALAHTPPSQEAT